jgi:glutamate-5-semialdehyde dehydrogenase
MAVRLVHDAKVQYPAVCNAIENLLIHQDIAASLLPVIVQDLDASGVELRGDAEVCLLAPSVNPADESDWETEYNDLILSVKLVPSLDAAIDFINTHGSGHSDAIVTGSAIAAERFASRVDSASVMINASTRFADGYRYGKGAEIGISTNKTHARGPVGLEGLVIYKYILRGNGQCVADYSGPNAHSYKHRRIL